jgi:hypothetical protein
MAQPITSQELLDYRKAIEKGGVAAVGQVYAELYAKGYNYAGWAEGVAKGNSLTGLVALHYMNESYYDEHGSLIPKAQVDKIRVDMALYTLDQYIYIAEHEGGGLLSRDLGYDETKNPHAKTFEENDLSLNNWTLNIPMELVRQKYGDEAVEELWVQIRDTGGDGPDAALVSIYLAILTAKDIFSENEATHQEALQWFGTLRSTDALTDRIEQNVNDLEQDVNDDLNDIRDTLEQIGHDIRDTLEQIGNDIRDVFSPPENSEGPIDSGNIDPGSIDSGYVDLGTVDFGNTNPGPIDSGYVDPGPVDCSDYGRFRTLRAE